jgi:hypothetical protein
MIEQVPKSNRSDAVESTLRRRGVGLLYFGKEIHGK